MPNFDPQKRYVSLNCARCGTQNNAARNQTCRHCGALLNAQAPSAPRSNSPAGSKFARSALTILKVVVVLVVLGVTYYFVRERINSLSPQTAVKETIALPADSWYQPSIWNLYRKEPTVREIAEKYEQVSGVTGQMKDVRNLSAKGKISFALGKCMTEKCSQKEAFRNKSIYWEPPPRKSEPAETQVSDDVGGLEFSGLGEVEFHKKDGNKVFRKRFFNNRFLSQRTENIHVFNGTEGWHEEIIYDWNAETGATGKLISRTIKDLESDDLEELKKSAGGVANDLSDKIFSYSHTAEINGNVNFVLRVSGSYTSETFYFDAVTGLLTKIDSLEFNCLMFPYADYDGVKMPSTMYFRTMNEDGRMIWIKTENLHWKLNQPIEDSIFEKRSE